MLMKKKRGKSQKMIMLKKLNHILPPSKIRITNLAHLLPPQKIMMTQSKKYRNKGLLQCLIDPKKLPNYKIIILNPELIISKENLDLSVFSRLGSSLENVTPDQKQIPRKII